MIIGLDTSAVGKKTTGTSVYINCLLETLKKTKHDVKTFSPENDGATGNNSLWNKMPIIKRGGIRRHLFRQFQLAPMMNGEDVGCAIFPNYLMPLDFNKPSAIVIHDLSFFSHPHFYSKTFVFYYKSQLKKILRKNPLVITISDYSKKCINKYLGIDEKEIYLLQGYIKSSDNLITKDIGKLKNERPYFLYVGHIEPRKNLSFLIKNFLEWKRERGVDYKLKLAGEVWSGSSEIQTLLKQFSSHPDVEFLNYVSEDDLRKLYFGASAFVHTSFVEGFGFPVLEAMNYGIPVLCSKGSGSEEISKSYSITIDPYNDDDLKKGLDKLAVQVNAERKSFQSKYSQELMNEQLNKILSAFERKKHDR